MGPGTRQVFIANRYMESVARIIKLPGLRVNFGAASIYAAFACDPQVSPNKSTDCKSTLGFRI